MNHHAPDGKTSFKLCTRSHQTNCIYSFNQCSKPFIRCWISGEDQCNEVCATITLGANISSVRKIINIKTESWTAVRYQTEIKAATNFLHFILVVQNKQYYKFFVYLSPTTYGPSVVAYKSSFFFSKFLDHLTWIKHDRFA